MYEDLIGIESVQRQELFSVGFISNRRRSEGLCYLGIDTDSDDEDSNHHRDHIITTAAVWDEVLFRKSVTCG